MTGVHREEAIQLDKSTYLSFAALPILAVGGAVGFAVAGSHAGFTTQPQTTQTVHTSNANHTTNTTVAGKRTQQSVDLTVLPGGRLGPDGKFHDVITNADFTVVQGVSTKITVYNYDSGKHSITSTALGVNLQAKGSAKPGVPGVTTLTFTPKKAGSFTWQCMDPCDGQNNDWSMMHDGYMEGTIKVLPQTVKKQFVYLTIKDGLKYAAEDKKIHDSFSPADFTVQKGIPVQVQVENYDSGQHSITSGTLGLNEIFKGATKPGRPSIETFTFTPKKAGQYSWQCVIPCDGNGWAMMHSGYMKGTITVE